ncbi:MAG TPA: YraN family protein [Desulfurivibrionaceae bacterium]|nr:YraN family protein [Desulfurivibrionaceae bacterium]
MSSGHLELGARGEAMAEQYLKRTGYRILARNYRCRYGEIDLIAEEGGNLVFIEVKTRSGAGFGHPLEAVDQRKRGQLTRTARRYLEENSAGERFCRFDVVAISLAGEPQLELVRNAFELEEER